MGNNPKLFEITKRIKSLYGQLYNMDKNNQLNENYYSLLEILKDLLVKEDEIYQNLTNEDIIFLYEYILMRQENPQKGFGTFSTDFIKYVADNDLIYDRINIRLGIYLRMRELGDINWYKNIYRGIYLNDNIDKSKEHDFYYFLIQSSWAVINYIKNVKSEYYTDENMLLAKYVDSFIDPFSESVLAKNKFKLDDDYSYILNTIDLIKELSSYMDASIIYYENSFINFEKDVMYGNITEVNEYFIDMLIGIESFLEIVNDNIREKILTESVDSYRMAKTIPNECTIMYFDLFNKYEPVKNIEKNKNIKGVTNGKT